MFKIINKSPLRTQSHTNPNLIRFNPSPKTPFESNKIVSPIIINPISSSYFQSEKRDNSAQMRHVPMAHDQQQSSKDSTKILALQNEIKSLKDRCSSQEQELQQKSNDINSLKDLLNSQSNQSFQNLRRAEEMLLNENEELRQLIITTQEQVKIQRREKEVALMELHNKVNEQNRDLEENRRMASIYESLKEENETLLRMIQQKDQEIESMMGHFQIEQEISQKQLAQLKEKLESENFMQNHIQQIDEANQELNRCLAQIESQQQELLELEEANRNYQRESDELHSGIDNKNVQIDEMVLKYGKIIKYLRQGELDEEYKQMKLEYENQIQDLKEQLMESNQYKQHREQLIQSLAQQLESQQKAEPNTKEQDMMKKLSEQHFLEVAKLKKEIQEKNEEVHRLRSEKKQF